MKKTVCNMFKILCVFAMATFAIGAYAGGEDNFKADVNAAIDDGLAYSRANNHFTVYTAANGLSLLTLLEKESIPAGYNGLSASDKLLAQNAACILIDNNNFGDRGGFYSYYDGQVLMGLSVYLTTGGPDTPAAAAGSNCTGRSARQTIDKVVDRSIAAQTASGVNAGYWDYQGPGADSSTTQFTLAGLSAAKGFYTKEGESLDKNRILLITTALNKTADGYAANGKQETGGVFTNCQEGSGIGCYGHGYQRTYGAGNNSSQQTASGTWGQLAGNKTINDISVQRYLRWLQNTYNPDTNSRRDSWSEAYFYFLWSSSKAYNLIEEAGILSAAGNIGPKDMGTLPATGIRKANRNPLTDVRPAPRGAGGAGYYGSSPAAPVGWYYDYAYRLMSIQTAAGNFPNPNGSWDAEVDHAYAILVLQRSLGGACADSDGDGVCDDVDNCPATPNPGQADSNKNGVGDACEALQKCDLVRDGVIDINDIKAITKLMGTKVPPSDVRADADSNRIININDVRACTLKCTNAKCVPNAPPIVP